MSDAFVVLNPVAGDGDTAVVKQALRRHLTSPDWSYALHETTPDEPIADVVRQNRERGYDLFIAVGGDGTVSGVAGGLVNTGIPLGIIPVGTGNGLAKDLAIPMDVDQALQIIVKRPAQRFVDAMRVEGRFFILNVGIGLSAVMMRDTGREEKRRFGPVAYLWTGMKKLFGIQPHRFAVSIDEQTHRIDASEIIVANSGIVGDPFLRLAPEIEMDDGQVDVCIMRARTLLDYFKIAWDILLGRQRRGPSIRCLQATDHVSIDTRHNLPVQADGEFIGHTPIEIDVVPDAVLLIVPAVHTSARRRLSILPQFDRSG
ncbi:MAG: diacylglycerol kinase family lipid kinase [Anaerolineae bacterium]|jgi:YegS/Rv2252/BmrU family lipid kinase